MEPRGFLGSETTLYVTIMVDTCSFVKCPFVKHICQNL